MFDNKHANIIILLFVIFVIGGLVLFFAYTNQPQKDISSVSISITPTVTPSVIEEKTYSGVTPCADCQRIDLILTLTPSSSIPAEGTFKTSRIYVGQSTEPIIETGNYTTEKGDKTDPDATVIVLNPDSQTDREEYLQFDEKTLKPIDLEGNIENYPLTLQ